jgi:hypothetical protein
LTTTQPNQLPAPAVRAATTSNLATLWGKAQKAAAILAAAVSLMAFSVAAHAAVVSVVFTNFGGGESLPC